MAVGRDEPQGRCHQRVGHGVKIGRFPHHQSQRRNQDRRGFWSRVRHQCLQHSSGFVADPFEAEFDARERRARPFAERLIVLACDDRHVGRHTKPSALTGLHHQAADSLVGQVNSDRRLPRGHAALEHLLGASPIGHAARGTLRNRFRHTRASGFLHHAHELPHHEFLRAVLRRDECGEAPKAAIQQVLRALLADDRIVGKHAGQFVAHRRVGPHVHHGHSPASSLLEQRVIGAGDDAVVRSRFQSPGRQRLVGKFVND